jgi:hypothetical protein
LIAFDKDGREIATGILHLGPRMTDCILDEVRRQPPTHIFFFSHGWKGDISAAIEQYDHWIGALLDLPADESAAASRTAAFSPLWIGLHWPSLPWGDEELGPAGFGADENAMGFPAMKQRYLDRLGDTPAIGAALDVIFEEARVNAGATELSPAVADAYQQLNDALGLSADGEGGAPDTDREPFDPVKSFQIAQAEAGAAGYGGLDWGGVLSPLRQLSFWTMKKRARIVGEEDMHQFVASLQRACNARIHLMGHSFGCIVVSSILGGPGGSAGLPRPVESAVLVQGALSLWSYCASIPKAGGRPGYFRRIIEHGAVKGPIVTTQSRYDSAVGSLYPWAAGVARQVDYAVPGTLELADLPKYGALGSFGVCGVEGVDHRDMLPQDGVYNFQPGRIYNLESSRFVRKREGLSGAHNDICGPEVAHAIWQAASA